MVCTFFQKNCISTAISYREMFHFRFQCWLKKQKDSLAPERQQVGPLVKWTSGLIFGRGEVSHFPLFGISHSFCAYLFTRFYGLSIVQCKNKGDYFADIQRLLNILIHDSWAKYWRKSFAGSSPYILMIWNFFYLCSHLQLFIIHILRALLAWKQLMVLSI